MNDMGKDKQPASHRTKRILFVCLGNICRSPMAETIMRRIVEEKGRAADFEIDSAGLIGYHEGEPADDRMRMHAARRGYRITHLSRPIHESDFRYFDLIIGMDSGNMDKLKRLSPDLETDKKLKRMTDFCSKAFTDEAAGRIFPGKGEIDHVPDPYYGGEQGFENVIDILEDACRGLWETLSATDGNNGKESHGH